MPYTTELTRDCLGIVHSGTGVLTGEELVAASVAATQLVQATENFQYEFSDFSEVMEVRIEPADLEKIEALDRIAAKSRPRAIVVIVAPGEAAHEMALKWETTIRDLGWTIHIARERTEAVRWLAQHLKTERPELLAERNENAA